VTLIEESEDSYFHVYSSISDHYCMMCLFWVHDFLNYFVSVFVD